MTDSAEKMRERAGRMFQEWVKRAPCVCEFDELMTRFASSEIIAALSASGTKSDGAKAIKTALIAAGCDTGDGSYVHAAMVSVIAAILADPIPSQPDKVEAIAETIWHAEYRRATGRERSVPWSEVSSTDRERYRYVADNILAMQAERRADNTVQRDRIYRAAERSNTRFGQWMPERWVNIFVEELNK